MALVLDRLADSFTAAQLNMPSPRRGRGVERLPLEASFQDIRWLAKSNYQLELPREAERGGGHLPQTDNESHGIEDLRMVRFVDDDAQSSTTAPAGLRRLPRVAATDWTRTSSGRVHTINGACAQNKGMALFPRGSRAYAMCSVSTARICTSCFPTSLLLETAECCRRRANPGSSCRSATAARPWKRPRVAAADPRRWTHAHLLHWRHAAGFSTIRSG